MVSAALNEKHLKQSKKAPSFMFCAFCLLYINSILFSQKITNFITMITNKSTFYSTGCPNHNRTAATWADIQERNYLASLNQQLVSEINDTLSQKHFYQTKLNYQYRNHHDQLQESFKVISEKNGQIIALQQQLDILKKDLRAAADDYISLKRNSQQENEALLNEMNNNKTVFQEKLQKIEEEFEQKCELRIKKRIQEVENQCEDRIRMFKSQIQTLTENSNRLTHQLSMLQDDYRQMLLKNDTIIQESIHRQLRKRDFEAQNNYLRDIAQYQTIKTERNQLRQQLHEQTNSKKQLQNQRLKLMASLQVYKQRIKDLQQALENIKQNEAKVLFEKYPESCEAETNTDKQFVPIAIPVDLNLMSEVVSLRQFLIQKLVLRLLQFYEKAAGSQKKTSKSLLTFTNCLNQLKKDCSDLKIILFLHGSLQKIVKIYCPTLINYSKEFLTIKDEFLRKSLIQCESIANNSQKLFRLLDTLFRIKNPLNHLKADLSPGELKLFQMKLMICLKKNFC